MQPYLRERKFASTEVQAVHAGQEAGQRQRLENHLHQLRFNFGQEDPERDDSQHNFSERPPVDLLKCT